MSAVDDAVFAELAERKAEIKRLKAELATCRELREYDSKEIAVLRETLAVARQVIMDVMRDECVEDECCALEQGP